MPVRVTRGTLIAHLYTYAPPRCRTSHYRMTFIHPLVSLRNDLVDPVFDGVGLAGFKSRSSAFLLTQLLSFFVFNYFPILFFSSIGWQCGAGVFGLIGCQSLSPGLELRIFFNINNNNNNNACDVTCIENYKQTSAKLFKITSCNIRSKRILRIKYIKT